MNETELNLLVSKQKIYDVLCRYCRVRDRLDKEMAYSVWHEDGSA